MGYNIKNIKSPLFTLFDFYNHPPSVVNLDSYLYINGITVYPTFRYNGRDANAINWNPWGYPNNDGSLTLQAGTAPTYNNGSPLLGTVDDSVLFNAGGWYKGGNIYEPTTKDIAIEVIMNVPTSGTLVYLQTSKTAPLMVLYIDTGGVLKFYINDNAGHAPIMSSAVSANFIHAMAFINRSEASTNGGQWYVNGLASGSGLDFSSASASITNGAGLFSIGAYQDGSSAFNSNMNYISGWYYQDWFAEGAAGPAEWANIAKSRFYKLIGLYPQTATGTYLPSVVTRATNAYSEKIEGDGTRRYYQVSPGWLRTCSRLDARGNTIKGYLAESGATNVILYSQALSSWLNSGNITIIEGGTGSAGPEGTLKLSKFVASTANEAHSAYKTETVTANVYTLSCFAKAGNKNWLEISTTAAAGADCYFDLLNGVIGTANGLIDKGIENWGNGLFRVWITFTAVAGSKSFIIYTAVADLNDTFAGNNSTVNTYVGYVQLELGYHPSSFVFTEASTGTRNADQLRYVATGNISVTEGLLKANVLLPNQNTTTDGYICSISAAGSTNNTIEIFQKASDDVLHSTAFNSSTQQYNLTGTTDLSQNRVFEIEHSWKTNEAKEYVNGNKEDSTDICTIPTSLDRIDIGQNEAGTNQFGGIISKLKIFEKSKIEEIINGN